MFHLFTIKKYSCIFMTASYCTRALSGLIIESLIRDHGIDFPYLVYMLFSFLLFVSFHHSSGCYFSTKRRDWLGRTSPKLPILCQVARNIFTYSFFFMILSILQVFTSHTTPSFFLIYLPVHIALLCGSPFLSLISAFW